MSNKPGTALDSINLEDIPVSEAEVSTEIEKLSTKPVLNPAETQRLFRLLRLENLRLRLLLQKLTNAEPSATQSNTSCNTDGHRITQHTPKRSASDLQQNAPDNKKTKAVVTTTAKKNAGKAAKNGTEPKASRTTTSAHNVIKPSTSKVTVDTSNRFDVLQDDTTDSADQTPSTDSENMITENTVAKEKSPPPVFINSATEWKKVAALIKNEEIQTKECKIRKDFVKVQPKSAVDYRKLTKALNEIKYEYYTYSLTPEKRLLVVIRGLPRDVETEDIKKELRELGYPVISVSRMRATSSLIVVSLERSDAGRQIYNLSNLCYLKVTVEAKRKSRDVVQCFRCQRYGHTSSSCRNGYRCVKCGDGHETKDCRSVRDIDPACCANCREEHTANYRGCKACPPRRPAVKKPATITNPSTVKSGKSFADATKNSQRSQPNKNDGHRSENPTTPENNLRSLQELGNLFNNFNIGKLLDAAKCIMEKIQATSTPAEMLMALVGSAPAIMSAYNG